VACGMPDRGATWRESRRRDRPELRHRLAGTAHADVLIVGTRTWSSSCRERPPARFWTRRLLREALRLPAGRPAHCARRFRPATFGVLELPSERFKVFRALDGERVFAYRRNGPCFRRPATDG